MLLTDIDLSDDTNILIQENGVTILGKDANTTFCKTQIDHNSGNVKSTENGL